MKKRYHGSCHCGVVKFSASVDLLDDTRRCNCSFCWKSRMWKVFAYKGDFALIKGESALSDYQASPSSWPEGDVHHYFCRHCGMHPFSQGYLEMNPFNGTFHAVNIACLDEVSEEDLEAAEIRYEDGRRDDYDHEPRHRGYL